MKLKTLLAESMYHSYAYSYPHKLSYRPFAQHYSLEQLWCSEDLSSLFLYIHLPFCEMRCGFCNLFTLAVPENNLVDRYLEKLKEQADALKHTLKPSFARIAVGGGTPSFLNEQQLIYFFDIIKDLCQSSAQNLPFSFEVSPATVNTKKLQLMKNAGVTRVSMGVQSFTDSELKSLGRPQKQLDVKNAIELIKQEKFDTLNLDLIYGMPDQSLESWDKTLSETLKFDPEELYLYPLYVRPLTGMGKRQSEASDLRFELYKHAQNFLLDQGYEQISKRLFRKRSLKNLPAPEYSCQEDGMIGLGAGARSYTTNIHYSSEYAVGKKGIKEIIESYVNSSVEVLNSATYGIKLNLEEKKRRFVIKSILHKDGVNKQQYRALFQNDLKHDFPQIEELQENQLTVETENQITLNQDGIDASDVIGPWLFSPETVDALLEFDLT